MSKKIFPMKLIELAFQDIPSGLVGQFDRSTILRAVDLPGQPEYRWNGTRWIASAEVVVDQVTGEIEISSGGIVYRQGPYTARDNAQHAVSATGTDETVLTVTIPASKLKADSVIEISPLWSCSSSANSKAFKILLNGQTVSSISQTAIQSFNDKHTVALRGMSAQVANNTGTAAPYGVTSTTGVALLTADLTSGATITFVINRTNAGDSAALERVLIEVL